MLGFDTPRTAQRLVKIGLSKYDVNVALDETDAVACGMEPWRRRDPFSVRIIWVIPILRLPAMNALPCVAGALLGSARSGARIRGLCPPGKERRACRVRLRAERKAGQLDRRRKKAKGTAGHQKAVAQRNRLKTPPLCASSACQRSRRMTGVKSRRRSPTPTASQRPPASSPPKPEIIPVSTTNSFPWP